MANKAYRVRDMQTGNLMDLLLVSNGDTPETWSLAVAGASGSASATIAGPLGSRSAATSVSTTQSTEDVARVGIITETAPASDTASSGLNGRLQRIAQRLTSLIALLPGSIGQKAKAAALAVSLSSDEDLLGYVGIVTETAPASDTASSGLNGRLQRIAQRLTSLIALIPAALGQGTMAQSLRVVLPSDQSTLTTQQAGFSFANITTNATTVVKSGAGVLHLVVTNTGGTGSTAVIYDNTAGSGTIIGTIATTLIGATNVYDVAFTIGCTIVTAGAAAADLTVSYR